MNTDRNYTDEELDQILDKMQAVSSQFYRGATQTGCHAFIEFCGLMNEFINICRATKAAGQDFTMANTHSGISLAAQPHHIDYLLEKLDCIYWPTVAAMLRDGLIKEGAEGGVPYLQAAE